MFLDIYSFTQIWFGEFKYYLFKVKHLCCMWWELTLKYLNKENQKNQKLCYLVVNSQKLLYIQKAGVKCSY